MVDKELLLSIINKISEEIKSNREIISKELNMGLFSGNAGISLFLFYLYDYSKDKNHYDTALYYLEESFKVINSGAMVPTFCTGIAGVAWTVNHLVEHSFIGKENLDVLDEFDDYLYKSMINFAKNDDFDFLHGATGIALYLTYRVKRNTNAIKYLREYVNLLKSYSILDPSTESVKIPSYYKGKDNKSKKVYNLSMAHGISSIIIVLSKIIAIEKNNSTAKQLMKGLANYILINENVNKSDNQSMFPSMIEKSHLKTNNNSEDTRLAWCYGDLGHGFALFHAYKTTHKKKYYDKSLEIFKNSSERKDLKKQNINDAGLCHGSAGIIDIFKTVNDYFEEYDFNDIEKYWVDLTLDFFRNGNGLKGFSKSTNKESEYSYSLLEGTAGIGLSLLSYFTRQKSEWNELFLSS